MIAQIVAQDGTEFDVEMKSVTPPQVVFREVKVYAPNGATGYIAGSHMWEPIRIETMDGEDYQKLIEASPFQILMNIGEQKWRIEQCWLMDEGGDEIQLPAPVYYKAAYIVYTK